MFKMFLFFALLIAVLVFVAWVSDKLGLNSPKPVSIQVLPPSEADWALLNASATYYADLAIILAKAMQNCAPVANIVAPKYQDPNPFTASDYDNQKSISDLLDCIGKIPDTVYDDKGCIVFQFRGKKLNSCGLDAKALERQLQAEVDILTRRRNWNAVNVDVSFRPSSITDYDVNMRFKGNVLGIVKKEAAL